jgi:hypothetical protein
MYTIHNGIINEKGILMKIKNIYLLVIPLVIIIIDCTTEPNNPIKNDISYEPKWQAITILNSDMQPIENVSASITFIYSQSNVLGKTLADSFPFYGLPDCSNIDTASMIHQLDSITIFNSSMLLIRELRMHYYYNDSCSFIDTAHSDYILVFGKPSPVLSWDCLDSDSNLVPVGFYRIKRIIRSVRNDSIIADIPLRWFPLQGLVDSSDNKGNILLPPLPIGDSITITLTNNTGDSIGTGFFDGAIALKYQKQGHITLDDTSNVQELKDTIILLEQ